VIVGFSDEQDDPLESTQAEWLVDLATGVLVAEGLDDDTHCGLAFVGPDHMASLNEDAMGEAGPTDVLSFPLEDAVPGSPPKPASGGPPIHLGDVVVCPSVVRANAAAAGVPFEDELALMVVHGMLHLLAYDHVDDADAERMEDRERELLAAAGRVRP
jgi:probable rRNA maturation factor